MSKFCTSCGASLDDNATFCTSCGAQLGNNQPANNASSSSADTVKDTFNNLKSKVDVDAIKDSLSKENIMNLKTNPNKTTIIALGTIAVLAIIILIILFNVIFAHPYKSALNNYFDGIAEGDGDKLVKAMPECQVEYIEDTYCDDDGDYDDAADYLSQSFEMILDSFEEEYGSDISISYKITDTKELSDKKLDKIKDNLKDSYDAKRIKVTKGYEIDVDLTIKGDEDKETDDTTITVAKVDGDWCVISGY